MYESGFFEKNEILSGLVGSSCHGTSIDGQDDMDIMAVFVEDKKSVFGLHSCDHRIWRTQPEGSRSQCGDIDFTSYSLRKFCRLATQGNPTILLLLWLPDYFIKTTVGNYLVNIREKFISKEAGERYLGYLTSQKMKLTGEKNKAVSRPELVEKYGYDTKFAMHALRLGFQGIQLMKEHRISLPVEQPYLEVLRAVREGVIPLNDTLKMIEDAECTLRTIVDNYIGIADTVAIDRFMVLAHEAHWFLKDSYNAT